MYRLAPNSNVPALVVASLAMSSVAEAVNSLVTLLQKVLSLEPVLAACPAIIPAAGATCPRDANAPDIKDVAAHSAPSSPSVPKV